MPPVSRAPLRGGNSRTVPRISATIAWNFTNGVTWSEKIAGIRVVNRLRAGYRTSSRPSHWFGHEDENWNACPSRSTLRSSTVCLEMSCLLEERRRKLTFLTPSQHCREILKNQRGVRIKSVSVEGWNFPCERKGVFLESNVSPWGRSAITESVFGSHRNEVQCRIKPWSTCVDDDQPPSDGSGGRCGHDRPRPCGVA